MPNCLVSCLQEEVEPFPEERENFLQQLYKFMEDRGESRAGTSVMFEVYFVNFVFFFLPIKKKNHNFLQQTNMLCCFSYHIHLCLLLLLFRDSH